MASQETDRVLIDVVFIQDVTAGLGSHVFNAVAKIKEIFAAITSSGKIQQRDDLRIGIVAFQQGQPTRVTDFAFAWDLGSIQQNAEALLTPVDGATVLEALRKALYMPWRFDACKIILLITDGLCEDFEEPSGFPWGSPDDWKNEIPGWETEEEKMHQRGIIFKHIIATSIKNLNFDVQDFFNVGLTQSRGEKGRHLGGTPSEETGQTREKLCKDSVFLDESRTASPQVSAEPRGGHIAISPSLSIEQPSEVVSTIMPGGIKDFYIGNATTQQQGPEWKPLQGFSSPSSDRKFAQGFLEMNRSIADSIRGQNDSTGRSATFTPLSTTSDAQKGAGSGINTGSIEESNNVQPPQSTEGLERRSPANSPASVMTDSRTHVDTAESVSSVLPTRPHKLPYSEIFKGHGLAAPATKVPTSSVEPSKSDTPLRPRAIASTSTPPGSEPGATSRGSTILLNPSSLPHSGITSSALTPSGSTPGGGYSGATVPRSRSPLPSAPTTSPTSKATVDPSRMNVPASATASSPITSLGSKSGVEASGQSPAFPLHSPSSPTPTRKPSALILPGSRPGVDLGRSPTTPDPSSVTAVATLSSMNPLDSKPFNPSLTTTVTNVSSSSSQNGSQSGVGDNGFPASAKPSSIPASAAPSSGNNPFNAKPGIGSSGVVVPLNPSSPPQPSNKSSMLSPPSSALGRNLSESPADSDPSSLTMSAMASSAGTSSGSEPAKPSLSPSSANESSACTPPILKPRFGPSISPVIPTPSSKSPGPMRSSASDPFNAKPSKGLSESAVPQDSSSSSPPTIKSLIPAAATPSSASASPDSKPFNPSSSPSAATTPSSAPPGPIPLVGKRSSIADDGRTSSSAISGSKAAANPSLSPPPPNKSPSPPSSKLEVGPSRSPAPPNPSLAPAGATPSSANSASNSQLGIRSSEAAVPSSPTSLRPPTDKSSALTPPSSKPRAGVSTSAATPGPNLSSAPVSASLSSGSTPPGSKPINPSWSPLSATTSPSSTPPGSILPVGLGGTLATPHSSTVSAGAETSPTSNTAALKASNPSSTSTEADASSLSSPMSSTPAVGPSGYSLPHNLPSMPPDVSSKKTAGLAVSGTTFAGKSELVHPTSTTSPSVVSPEELSKHATSTTSVDSCEAADSSNLSPPAATVSPISKRTLDPSEGAIAPQSTSTPPSSKPGVQIGGLAVPLNPTSSPSPKKRSSAVMPFSLDPGVEPNRSPATPKPSSVPLDSAQFSASAISGQKPINPSLPLPVATTPPSSTLFGSRSGVRPSASPANPSSVPTSATSSSADTPSGSKSPSPCSTPLAAKTSSFSSPTISFDVGHSGSPASAQPSSITARNTPLAASTPSLSMAMANRPSSPLSTNKSSALTPPSLKPLVGPSGSSAISNPDLVAANATASSANALSSPKSDKAAVSRDPTLSPPPTIKSTGVTPPSSKPEVGLNKSAATPNPSPPDAKSINLSSSPQPASTSYSSTPPDSIPPAGPSETSVTVEWSSLPGKTTASTSSGSKATANLSPLALNKSSTLITPNSVPKVDPSGSPATSNLSSVAGATPPSVSAASGQKPVNSFLPPPAAALPSSALYSSNSGVGPIPQSSEAVVGATPSSASAASSSKPVNPYLSPADNTSSLNSPTSSRAAVGPSGSPTTPPLSLLPDGAKPSSATTLSAVKPANISSALAANAISRGKSELAAVLASDSVNNSSSSIASHEPAFSPLSSDPIVTKSSIDAPPRSNTTESHSSIRDSYPAEANRGHDVNRPFMHATLDSTEPHPSGTSSTNSSLSPSESRSAGLDLARELRRGKNDDVSTHVASSTPVKSPANKKTADNLGTVPERIRTPQPVKPQPMANVTPVLTATKANHQFISNLLTALYNDTPSSKPLSSEGVSGNVTLSSASATSSDGRTSYQDRSGHVPSTTEIAPHLTSIIPGATKRSDTGASGSGASGPRTASFVPRATSSVPRATLPSPLGTNDSKYPSRPPTLPAGMRWLSDPEEPDVPFVPKVEVSDELITEALAKRMVYLYVARKQRLS